MKKWSTLTTIKSFLQRVLLTAGLTLFLSLLLLITGLYIPNISLLVGHISLSISILTLIVGTLLYPIVITCQKAFFRHLSENELNVLRLFISKNASDCLNISNPNFLEDALLLREKRVLTYPHDVLVQSINPFDDSTQYVPQFCIMESAKKFLERNHNLLDRINPTNEPK